MEKIEDRDKWANDQVLTDDERYRIRLLRDAGCRCPWPLLGERPNVGPRCRLCNTVGRWDEL